MRQRRRRRNRGRQGFAGLLCVCAAIVVLGGGYLGLRALLSRGGEQNPPVASQTPSHTEKPAPDLPPEPTLTPEGVRAVKLSDMADNAPYRDAMSYCVLKGYLDKGADDAVDPDRLVTNEELAAAICAATGQEYSLAVDDAGALANRQILAGFLVAAATGLELDMTLAISLDAYPDAHKLAPEMREGMAWVLGAGLFTPIVKGEIHPNLAVSRAQLAQVLLNLDALREKNGLAQALQPKYELVKTSLSAETLASLQKDLDTAVKQYAAVGAQAALIQKGEVVASLAAGWATRDADPMTVEHKMRIASISKVAVGLAAMSLTEDGVVDLDAPIGRYWGADFKNPSYPDVPVTMRNIMSHTSSLIAAGDNTSRAYADVKAKLSGSGGYTGNRPGDMAGWSYNNYAFSILGMTLELAEGKIMDDIMDQRFFAPLGIDAAFEMGEIKATDKLMTLYREDRTPWRTAAEQRTVKAYNTPGENGKYFAGGLTISAEDMAKLMILLTNDGVYQGVRLLEAASVAEMETLSAEKVSEEEIYQALPLDYQEGLYGRKGIYYHNGNAYGAFTCASYDPETGDGAVVLFTGSYPGKKDGVYVACHAVNQSIYAALS